MTNFLVETAWAVRHRLLKTLWRRGEAEAFQPLLERQLLDMGVTLAIDVGGNRGQYGRLLRRVGFKGHIASFEPLRANVAHLQRAADADGNWSVHAYALGSTSGELTMNVSRRSEFSSFLNASAAGRTAFAGEIDTSEQEVVPIRTLDDVYPELKRRAGVGGVHLKLDTQGFDLEVLKGAAQVVGEVASLQTELPFVALYDGMPTSREVLNFLDGAGYHLTAFYPVSRDRLLRVLEADCLFRRVV